MTLASNWAASLVLNLFGPPAAELRFENTRILVYNRSSDLRFRKFFQSTVAMIMALHPLERRGDHADLPARCLPSGVGMIEGNARMARSGAAFPGFLVYGPYIRLKPGDYAIRLGIPG